MNYVSTKTIESKTQAGARFVIRKMNDRRRQALELSQSEVTAKLKLLFQEFNPLDREYAEAWRRSKAVGESERAAAIAAGATEAEALKAHPHGPLAFSDEKFARWAELRTQVNAIERDELIPAALRFVVVRLEDYEIDGETADLEKLLADGPDEFRDEIVDAVKRELGLLPAEQENLKSPSTLGGAEGGSSPNGTVSDAATSETISDAVAPDTTVPESASAPIIESAQ